MKLICIGRNYIFHVKELGNEIPKSPVFFLKPETSILPKSHPFIYPNFTKQLEHEVELVYKICKTGKKIKKKFAYKYYNAIGVGIDFTARDVQNECKKKGLPWEKAKAFDFSAILSELIPIENFNNLNNISFSLMLNNKIKQAGNNKDMIFDIDNIISFISKYITLKIGDLIFTGTPAGVSQVKIGDEIKCFLENNELISFKVF